MKDVKLLGISNAQMEKAGELILYFSHIEWLIANVIFYSQIPVQEYKAVKDFKIIEQALQAMFQLGFGRKLELLKSLGFDTTTLKEVKDLRDAIAHGVLFDIKGVKTLSYLSKNQKIVFDDKDMDLKISLLRQEGGKLITFLESQGYSIAVLP